MSSGSFVTVSLYLSTSVSNTAARNGDGTEVTVFLSYLAFCPAASFLCLLHFVIPLSPLIHPFSSFNIGCTVSRTIVVTIIAIKITHFTSGQPELNLYCMINPSERSHALSLCSKLKMCLVVAQKYYFHWREMEYFPVQKKTVTAC